MKQSICKKCSKEFSHPDSRDAIYCSLSCSNSSRARDRIVIYCKTCAKEMVIIPSMARDAKYCSYKCFEERKTDRPKKVVEKKVVTFWDDASLI
jgi:hypothetical protein